MTKKCLGCGITLQSDNPSSLGYTPRIENDYCQRCFQIRNYNKKEDIKLEYNNLDIIKRINKEKGFVIYLVDFLNIYEDIIKTFKQINSPKILVITKSDLIAQNINKNKLILRIKQVYGIEEDIFYFSTKTKENLSFLTNLILEKTKVIITGFTNSGKSSFLNLLTNANITVSSKANTTLDFLKIKFSKTTLIDTPGFTSNNFIDDNIFKGQIRPISYQLKNKYCLFFNNIYFSLNNDNNVTLYLNRNIRIEKRRKKDVKEVINVPNNSDVLIKGLGFIHVKKSCLMALNIALDLVEVRESIVGGSNE